MQTFQKLKRIRSLFSTIPGIATCKDFDIAVEIGYYQQLGTPLSMKQLILLNIAPPATMRRHLNRLVKEGTVIKHTSSNDLRIVHFSLSQTAMQSFSQCLDQIRKTLSQVVTPETYTVTDPN
jgi:DNA-binding MarR family transcriptional regulator